jgi:phosphatidylglycerophosphate synthase
VNRLPLAEMERLCQKPEHRRIGNWMARRVARPAALRITWLIAPYGVTAHATTLLAWAVGIAAAAQFAIGTPTAWLCAAITLQLWYLLDHVDGQLARLRGTASLDGVQLDYLMHHSLNLLVPLGLGYGVARAREHDAWLACGLAAGVSALLVGLLYDTRYKAFVQRLKRVRGELRVQGGGGAQPSAQPSIPRNPVRFASWCAHKTCEPHVVMNLATTTAIAAWLFHDQAMTTGAILIATLAAANTIALVTKLTRSLQRHTAEIEFAHWFAPNQQSELIFRDGWWVVEESRSQKSEVRR